MFHPRLVFLALGDLDEGLAGIDLLTDELDDLGRGALHQLGTGHIDLKAGVLLDHLGAGERIVVGQVHTLGLFVELHDAQVGNHHLGTTVAGQAGALTTARAVHPAAGGDVVDLLHEAAFLVLHHDDGVAVGSDAVGAAGTGETGLGLDIVALAVDAGGVHVAVGIDLGAADEGNQTVGIVEPLVGLKADETDVGPLHGAVSHEAVVAHGAGHLNRIAVHQAALHDGMAGGANSPLGQGGADQRKAGAHDHDLVLLDVLSDGVSLHLLLSIIRIISHCYVPPNS